jgi:hypothetical protein
MAIRIRRGTDAQRSTVVFEMAEVAFATDTEKFYIGDGVTPGGILIDDQTLSYNAATNTITTADGNTVVLTNIPTLAQTTTWDTAYNNMVVSATITGDVTKTLNLNQQDGGSVTVSYKDTHVHTQGSPSATWVITHNMNKFPSVTVVDSGENIVEGEVIYNNLNQLTINFSGGFSGKAYIN